ncbi:zinc finger protein 260-like isoform X2 [Hylaeus anthracinus]|uniref:zinc finger protein 260-like isoform X2 n=1 Tax=Hylaeus volcanicus TaxID=313075 RepID=UPI0023B83C6A|nr:zinc finger protein 260-like isoform X2 [Hylaeus volcanicus]XP_054006903.1 zinc finger protein 260-like isoform X2 [Hylaeus anthracinus]
MEVTTEEAQAVLLEGMEGAQYITIQRADGEPLSKSVPLLTLNGELISERMVVDMINAGVGTDYGTATQYYEADDLLQHELTEQQQKQQQLHSQSQHEDPTLPDVSHLGTLTPVNTYSIQTVPEPNAPPVYPTLQPFKRITHNIKQEFIVKTEYDIDVSAESSEDAAPSSGPKRSLPHKKRIPRKLKQQTKRTSSRKDSSRLNSDAINVQSSGDMQAHVFKCELCNSKFSSQLNFFEHLKVHYEPVKQETRIAQATNTNITISVPESVQRPENTVIEEFSEPEDLMEGIRGVVEETGAHIDDDTESQLSTVNNESQIWTITGITEHVHRDHVKPPTVSEQGLHEKEKTDIPQTTKKKKILKARKTNEEWSCPQCDRLFHHKNSLVYHMRCHNGERPHQCEVCGKSFFTASPLKVHKRLHSGDKPYKCKDCGRQFRQWGDLKYHSTSIHSEQKQYQCEYCGKDFARKYSLIVHRRIHTGERNYRCEYCNKTFRASSYLQIHRRIHTGEKPHACTVCGKLFRVGSDLKRHMHTHSRTRADRPLNRVISGKTIEDENDKGAQAKTIHDLVRDLKLEVEGTGVMETVPPDDNPECILPHAGGQTLEYTVTTTSDTSQERDPLEAVVRTTDNMQYFFM